MLGDPCIQVTSAKVVGPFSVRLTFNDGTRRRVNLRAPLRGPVFEPLRDPKEFARLRYRRGWGTIAWPNGADIAPETLHALPEESEPADAAMRPTRSRSRRRPSAGLRRSVR